MRMWSLAADAASAGEVGGGDGDGNGTYLALANYEAIGGFRDALSRHADSVYAALDDTHRSVARRMFQCLCERGPDLRTTRRPAKLSEVAAVADVAPADVALVADAFRASNRCFLNPPADRRCTMTRSWTSPTRA